MRHHLAICKLQASKASQPPLWSLVNPFSTFRFFLSLSIGFFRFALGFSNRNLTEIYTELELKNSATYSIARRPCAKRVHQTHQRFVKHNYVLSFIHCHGKCVYIVFTVNSSVNASRSSCQRQFHLKGIKLKTFPQGYVISLCARVKVSTLYSGTGTEPEF